MRVKTPSHLGALVREQRQRLGLSQADLAARAGVGRPWLSKVETGHPNAELGRVLRVLAELGLTVDVSAGSTIDRTQNSANAALPLSASASGPVRYGLNRSEDADD
ncbi:MAG: hypothetical protein NVS3B1_02000 [Marmoricola sp.]